MGKELNKGNNMSLKESLIKSDEFEKALIEGAEYKKDMVTSYKSQNKLNFNSFYEIMLESNDEAQRILSIKKKKRTDSDNQYLNDFKKDVRSMYSQVQSLTIDEHLEDGKKSKVEKIVDKIIPVIEILRYIGKNELENEFNRRGLKLTIDKSLEEKYPALNSDAKRESIKGIFNSATNIKQKTVDDNSYINEDLFIKKVPVELQYDKGSNNTGLKAGDWRKLVDAKAKLIMATTDTAKEKAEEKIEHLAEEKMFEAARAELVNSALLEME